MSKTTDWMPGTRQGQISMAHVWREEMNTNATAWNIPAAAVQEFVTLTAAADTALETALNESTRTPVANAQCKTTFEALTARMRDTKRRYFLEPPLDVAAFISLGLHPHDTTPTPSGSPTAQVTIETYLVGRHELGVKIIYLTGNPNDAANKGYRIGKIYAIIRTKSSYNWELNGIIFCSKFIAASAIHGA